MVSRTAEEPLHGQLNDDLLRPERFVYACREDPHRHMPLFHHHSRGPLDRASVVPTIMRKSEGDLLCSALKCPGKVQRQFSSGGECTLETKWISAVNVKLGHPDSCHAGRASVGSSPHHLRRTVCGFDSMRKPVRPVRLATEHG